MAKPTTKRTAKAPAKPAAKPIQAEQADPPVDNPPVVDPGTTAGATDAAAALDAKAKTEAEAAAKAKNAPVLVVTGPKKGRWRAGRFFTRAELRIPLGELSEAELEAIQGDPALACAIEGGSPQAPRTGSGG